MPKAEKCLHREIAKHFAEICKEDTGFKDFLEDVFPEIDMEVCCNCRDSRRICRGEFYEPHPATEAMIAGLEQARIGFYDEREDEQKYTRRQKEMRLFHSLREDSRRKASRSVSLVRAVDVDVELLTGDPRIDRYQVAAALEARDSRRSHFHDYDSVQEVLDEDN